MKPLEHAAIGS